MKGVPENLGVYELRRNQQQTEEHENFLSCQTPLLPLALSWTMRPIFEIALPHELSRDFPDLQHKVVPAHHRHEKKAGPTCTWVNMRPAKCLRAFSVSCNSITHSS